MLGPRRTIHREPYSPRCENSLRSKVRRSGQRSKFVGVCNKFGGNFSKEEDSGGRKGLAAPYENGRPLVDHEYLKRIEEKTGRNLPEGKPRRKLPDSWK